MRMDGLLEVAGSSCLDLRFLHNQNERLGASLGEAKKRSFSTIGKGHCRTGEKLHRCSLNCFYRCKDNLFSWLPVRILAES